MGISFTKPLTILYIIGISAKDSQNQRIHKTKGFTKPKANLSIFSRDMFNIENQN
jgi:hypothetical protein